MIISSTPSAILTHALEQARAHGVPGEMRNRLRLAAEYAEKNGGKLPPWLEFGQMPKESHLPVLKQEETPC